MKLARSCRIAATFVGIAEVGIKMMDGQEEGAETTISACKVDQTVVLVEVLRVLFKLLDTIEKENPTLGLDSETEELALIPRIATIGRAVLLMAGQDQGKSTYDLRAAAVNMLMNVPASYVHCILGRKQIGGGGSASTSSSGASDGAPGNDNASELTAGEQAFLDVLISHLSSQLGGEDAGDGSTGTMLPFHLSLATSLPQQPGAAGEIRILSS
jgi:hypothetical protein